MADIKKKVVALPSDLYEFYEDMSKKMNIPMNSAIIIALNAYVQANDEFERQPDAKDIAEHFKTQMQVMLQEIKQYMGQPKVTKFKK